MTHADLQNELVRRSRQRAGALDPTPAAVEHALHFIALCNRYSEPLLIDDRFHYPDMFYAQERALRTACNLLARYFHKAMRDGGAV